MPVEKRMKIMKKRYNAPNRLLNTIEFAFTPLLNINTKQQQQKIIRHTHLSRDLPVSSQQIISLQGRLVMEDFCL